jgi:phage shock protein A
MGIFSRFSDIVNSNLNAMLDKAENPERMLGMMIEEMQQTIIEVRSVSAKAIADKKDLSRRIQNSEKAVALWQDKAEVALSKNREDLAKAALIEKNECSKVLTAQQEEYSKVEVEIQKLSADLQQLQDKLQDAKSRRDSVLSRQKMAETRLAVRRQAKECNIDDALERFEHFQVRMDKIEAEIESYDLGKAPQSLSAQIDDLVHQESIEKELAALKERVKPASNKSTAKASA